MIISRSKYRPSWAKRSPPTTCCTGSIPLRRTTGRDDGGDKAESHSGGLRGRSGDMVLFRPPGVYAEGDGFSCARGFRLPSEIREHGSATATPP